jgi:transposase
MAISHLEVPMNVHQTASAIEAASQGARRATEEAASIAPPPDPEVAATAKRRQFSPSERRRILAAADRCSKNGEIGALLRREGIYSSHLATWRKQREATERAGLESKKRGRKADPAIAEARRVAELTRENERLRHKLAQAHTIIDVQKKLCTLLGLPTAEDPEERS